MAITINGTGTITGISAGGLPDGSVVAADLASTLDLSGKTVTLPSGTGGVILQTQFAIKTSTATIASTTPSVISGLTVDIIPAHANNLIILIASVSSGYDSNNWGLGFYFGKDGSVIDGARADAQGRRASRSHHRQPSNCPADRPAIRGSSDQRASGSRRQRIPWHRGRPEGSG